MNLSFITDEATQSFDTAVAFAKDHGLAGLELRSAEDTPIDRIPLRTLYRWRATLDGEGLAVPCVSGSFYKCAADDADARAAEMEKLARLCDAADALGCGLIRGFAFFRPESGPIPPERLAPYFDEPAALLRKRGKRLLLEADPSVNTSNHKALAALLALLDPTLFGAVYDPGNDLFDPLREQPYPAGYQAVRPHLAHVHVKDAVYGLAGDPVCVAPGQGLVGWPELLRRLIADGYEGWLSLETHYRKNVLLSEELMRLPQGSAFTQGGMEATAESAQALCALLAAAGKETFHAGHS